MLLKGNGNDVVIRRLRTRAGTAITTATLNYERRDPNDTVIDSGSLTHEGSGDYAATSNAQLTAGIEYLTVVTGTIGSSPFRRELREVAIDPEV